MNVGELLETLESFKNTLKENRDLLGPLSKSVTGIKLVAWSEKDVFLQKAKDFLKFQNENFAFALLPAREVASMSCYQAVLVIAFNAN